MITSAETAVRDADRTEAVQKKAERESYKRTSIEATKVAVETQIDDDQLGGIASEEGVDGDVSEECREVGFSTPISPPRGMLPPPRLRPTTPEALPELSTTKKRTVTLVNRTPEELAPSRSHLPPLQTLLLERYLLLL
jgi:hypothetical protein